MVAWRIQAWKQGGTVQSEENKVGRSTMPRSSSEMFSSQVNHEEMVKAALWNVDYHLRAVNHFHQRPGMSTIREGDASLEEARKRDLQADVNRFHAHLRAFFWELVAAFE